MKRIRHRKIKDKVREQTKYLQQYDSFLTFLEVFLVPSITHVFDTSFLSKPPNLFTFSSIIHHFKESNIFLKNFMRHQKINKQIF